MKCSCLCINIVNKDYPIDCFHLLVYIMIAFKYCLAIVVCIIIIYHYFPFSLLVDYFKSSLVTELFNYSYNKCV